MLLSAITFATSKYCFTSLSSFEDKYALSSTVLSFGQSSQPYLSQNLSKAPIVSLSFLFQLSLLFVIQASSLSQSVEICFANFNIIFSNVSTSAGF